jgi:hypothetical protein
MADVENGVEVSFDIDASEAFQALAERIVRIEREMKAVADQQAKQAIAHQQIVELVEQMTELFTAFQAQIGPAMKDIAIRLAALTLEVERRERPLQPPGGSSVN